MGPWVPLITAGVTLSIIGGVIAGVSAAHNDSLGDGDPQVAGVVVGAIVGGIGSLVLLVGLVALGAYLGVKYQADVTRWAAGVVDGQPAGAADRPPGAPRDPGTGR